MALDIGKHDADLHLVIVLVEDLRDMAVEGGTQLTSRVFYGESYCPTPGSQAVNELLLAIRHVVLDGAYSGDDSQGLGQFEGRLFEVLWRRPAQLHVHGPSRVPGPS